MLSCYTSVFFIYHSSGCSFALLSFLPPKTLKKSSYRISSRQITSQGFIFWATQEFAPGVNDFIFKQCKFSFYPISYRKIFFLKFVLEQFLVLM